MLVKNSYKLTGCDRNGCHPYPATGDMQPLRAQDLSFNILYDSKRFGGGFTDEQEHKSLMSTEDMVPPANATTDEGVAEEYVQVRPQSHNSARSSSCRRQGHLRRETRPPDRLM